MALSVRTIGTTVCIGLLPFLMVGCGDRTPPVLSDVEVSAPSDHTPLAALLTLSTDEPARVTLEITDGREGLVVEPDATFATMHRVPVLGLRPDGTYDVTLTLTDQAGNTSAADPVTITTDPLPDNFPPFVATISEPTRMEPGITLLPMYRWTDGGSIDDTYGLIVALDAAGEVVWYHRTDRSIGDVIQLQNGHLMYRATVDGIRSLLVEIDLLGRVVQQWHPRALAEAGLEDSTLVDVDSFHHEVAQLPSGNFLTLSSEVRTFDDYPSSADVPDASRVTQDVVGDVIIEFARDGTVLTEIPLLDVVDPYRVGYDSLGQGYWRATYAALMDEEPGVVDWAHANALAYDAETDSFVVALRHQDAIVKIGRSTRALSWILGSRSGWTGPWERRLLRPRGDLAWAYHSHGLEITPQRTLLLYDNGNSRASPFEEQMPESDRYSRVVEYDVDEAAMEVREVWTYGGPDGEQFYSSFLSDADWMPTTGNVLITDGARTSEIEDATSGETVTHNWLRIVEVTHTTPADKVFELVIDDEPPNGWRVYRAARLPGFYPERPATTSMDGN